MPKIVDKPMMKKQIMEAALKAFLKQCFKASNFQKLQQSFRLVLNEILKLIRSCFVRKQQAIERL